MRGASRDGSVRAPSRLGGPATHTPRLMSPAQRTRLQTLLDKENLRTELLMRLQVRQARRL